MAKRGPKPNDLRLKIKEQSDKIASLRVMLCRLRKEKRVLRGKLSGVPAANLTFSVPGPVLTRLKAICAENSITLELLLDGCRIREVVEVRWLVIWELYAQRRPSGRRRFSLERIGGFLNMHHTSVLHAWRKRPIGEQRDLSPEMQPRHAAEELKQEDHGDQGHDHNDDHSDRRGQRQLADRPPDDGEDQADYEQADEDRHGD